MPVDGRPEPMPMSQRDRAGDLLAFVRVEIRSIKQKRPSSRENDRAHCQPEKRVAPSRANLRGARAILAIAF